MHPPSIATDIVELWVLRAKWSLLSPRAAVGLVCLNSRLALKRLGGLSVILRFAYICGGSIYIFLVNFV